MLIIGLDAASDFAKFGYAIGRYEQGRVRIESAGLLKTPSQENALISIIGPVLKNCAKALIAIDAPLGWPVALALGLKNHQAGEAFTFDKNVMFHRSTDNYVHALIKKKPLEIGADKIARAAHSALGALKCLRGESGKQIPLAWKTNLLGVEAIEVYPAGTLKALGLPSSKYKKPEQISVRLDIVKGLSDVMPDLVQYIKGSDDVFDACLCLIAAKDFLEGLASPPSDIQLAQREGWIWVRNPK
jgi:predicted RNase H-like nuclease